MLDQPRLAVASGGGGVLARRAGAMLFVAGDHAAAMVERFLGAPDSPSARAGVLAALSDAGLVGDPLVMIGWAGAAQIVVFGDLQVSSDLPSMPMISGVGSASWVERGVEIPAAGCTVSCAPPSAVASGSLQLGFIPADGFELWLPGADDTRTADEPQPSTAAVQWELAADQAPAPRADAVADVVADAVPDIVADAGPAAVADTPWDLLHGAVGGEWMEDSLGIPEAAVARPAGSTGVVPSPPSFDPEMTLDAAKVVVPTIHHAVRSAEAAGVDGAGAEDPAAAPLAVIVLPDGQRLPVTVAIAIGRQPSLDGARLTHGHVVPIADAGAHVSRTHVVIRPAATVVEVFDCQSSGHTVVVHAGATEPLMLDPWSPHEVGPGDSLYLGGPTQIRVEGFP